ncbi:MAG: hypothetical protein A2Y56_02040 [Candidatus Aminicenantes bacterium RBG_13_63_10]|nr:MAG: hypothetical protein A2Y56_02040 [Candidatus Aminicenantes bacterium RBG_13_63_10]
MNEPVCRHKWAMADIRDGYLVTEGCFHCLNRISFFSDEPVPPIESYHEGAHFWNYLGSAQATKFDLRCETCGQVVALKELMALMLCVRCDPECGVFKAAELEGGERVWVYVALCADTSHASRNCVPEAGIRALNEYYQGGQGEPRRIKVVPCRLRRSVDSCQGIVLADVGLTELY